MCRTIVSLTVTGRILSLLAVFVLCQGQSCLPTITPPSVNLPPVADAGPNISATAGEAVALSGLASMDPDGDSLTFMWRQTEGPSLGLGTVFGSAVTFTPDMAGVYQLELTVTDDRGGADSDTVMVVVNGHANHPAPPVPPGSPDTPADPPPPSEGVTVNSTWSNANSDMYCRIDWWLPSKMWYQNVARDNWGRSGVESISAPAAVVADGCHVLRLQVKGAGCFAGVNHSSSFLGHVMEVHETLGGGTSRYVAYDVVDGDPMVVWSNWYDPESPESGELTGRQLVEVQAAWTDAAPTAYVAITLRTPSGVTIRPLFDWEWNQQGFRRLVVAAGTRLEDGVYRLEFKLQGSGSIATVKYQVQFLGRAFEFSTVETMLGPATRTIDLKVSGGQVSVLSNGWVE